MLKKTLVIVFILVAHGLRAQVLPSFGDSRTGTTGMQFLKIPVDARSAGLAGSYIAMANDVAALYWNPAGITRVDTQRIHLQASHTSYFADISASFGGAVFRTGRGTFFGISTMAMDYGEIEETTEFQPLGTGRTFTVSNYLVGLTYARVLTGNFSFGVTGKFAHEGIAGVNTNNVMFDLGLSYLVGVKNARFGLSMSNFGFNVRPDGSVQILKFTGEEEINDFEVVSVPAIFRIGLAFDPIEKKDHVLTLSTQLNHPTDNNETFSFGGEYLYRRILFVRTGYEFGVDEVGLPALGLGVKLQRRFGGLRFDYGFNNKESLGSTHRITMGVSLK